MDHRTRRHRPIASRRGRTAAASATALALLPLTALPAAAGLSIGCGHDIVASGTVVLYADVVCEDGDLADDEAALTVLADDVTIDLNGHSILLDAAAIDDDEAHGGILSEGNDRVAVVNTGLATSDIEGFDYGIVLLEGDGLEVRGSGGGGIGILLGGGELGGGGDGDGPKAAVGFVGESSAGVVIGGAQDAVVEGVATAGYLDGSSVGVLVGGSSDVEVDRVRAFGFEVAIYATEVARTRLRRNVVGFSEVGILLERALDSEVTDTTASTVVCGLCTGDEFVLGFLSSEVDPAARGGEPTDAGPTEAAATEQGIALGPDGVGVALGPWGDAAALALGATSERLVIARNTVRAFFAVGILLVGDLDSRIQRNVVSDYSLIGFSTSGEVGPAVPTLNGAAIVVGDSAGTYVRRNRLERIAQGVIVAGTLGVHVERNVVQQAFGGGVWVEASTAPWVHRNRVSDGLGGWAFSDAFPAAFVLLEIVDASIERNVAEGNEATLGFLIADSSGSVVRNSAIRNGGRMFPDMPFAAGGFLIADHVEPLTFSRNVARLNGGVGHFSYSGDVAGRRNRSVGNLVDECVGVACR